MNQAYSLDQLCSMVDLSKRTVRYYMQLSLVDRPEGETRAAQYGSRHLEQLLRIKQLSAAGISLERIKEILHGEPAPVPTRRLRPGDIQVCSQVYIAPGVELHIDPEASAMSPEILRSFVKAVLEQWENLHAGRVE